MPSEMATGGFVNIFEADGESNSVKTNKVVKSSGGGHTQKYETRGGLIGESKNGRFQLQLDPQKAGVDFNNLVQSLSAVE